MFFLIHRLDRRGLEKKTLKGKCCNFWNLTTILAHLILWHLPRTEYTGRKVCFNFSLKSDMIKCFCYSVKAEVQAANTYWTWKSLFIIQNVSKKCEVAVPNCLSLKLWTEIVASIFEFRQLLKYLYNSIAKCMYTQAAFLAWGCN